MAKSLIHHICVGGDTDGQPLTLTTIIYPPEPRYFLVQCPLRRGEFYTDDGGGLTQGQVYPTQDESQKLRKDNRVLIAREGHPLALPLPSVVDALAAVGISLTPRAVCA